MKTPNNFDLANFEARLSGSNHFEHLEVNVQIAGGEHTTFRISWQIVCMPHDSSSQMQLQQRDAFRYASRYEKESGTAKIACRYAAGRPSD